MESKYKISVSRFAPKFHVKKGDEVMIIAGEFKGKQGKVLKIYTKTGRATVEGINVVTRHYRKNAQTNNEGRVLEKEAPIHISNLMLIDPKTGSPTRVGIKIENNKKIRYAKKSGEVIK
ncbi:MAG: 50S ribosomal protein L24 [Sphingobacteriales bacterium]|jgi:large subunit ribosomal protein L24|nr:50S ribosomal protein L24 [Sphingobacteriales bacterium]MBP9140479.1 50S ribosomal protein L24 [Chitinophagales bacterium]MDA0197421.1 50S ribosomal protein L24 [Bacteroidota bacterium]MBK6891261.1 50S ribosomal protein L24 [Sphingobacteriales bacterium]MBK7526910.1 50S ribosomal protein L24 [Sphingobacteriales bacterium]